MQAVTTAARGVFREGIRIIGCAANVGTCVGAVRASGFSMIELVVAIAICGILAAVAISEFHRYRASGYDHTGRAALESALQAEEAFFNANGKYTNFVSDLVQHGYRETPNVRVVFLGPRPGDSELHLSTEIVSGCAVGTGIWNYRKGDISSVRCQ